MAIEGSAMEIGSDDPFNYTTSLFVGSGAIDARARLTGNLYANARFPISLLGQPGNLMGGADYTVALGTTNWLSFGGALGLPLVKSTSFTSPYNIYSNALWGLHEYFPGTVPLRIDLGFEMVRGSFGFRVEAQPVILFPVDRPGSEVELSFQHAAEFQYGHSLGVGLRLQGVANSINDQDNYQSAFEPFVVVRREIGFARLGVLKTLDEDSPGSPYSDSWGARLTAGIHLD